MPTILQISDAHLSPRSPLFRENFARIRALAEALAPDLVVATGDLSLDGADHEEDLAFAAELHADLPAPLLALPGNHDVGSHARTMPRQPVDAARLDRFRAHLGPGRGVVDLPGWRVIGLNSEVMGTGLAEEAEQAATLPGLLADAGERRIALFLHKPVFVTAPEDPTFDYWSVPPAARPALAPVLDHPALRLVGSGHLHLHHRFERGRVAFAWAPPLSFLVHPDEQPGLPGERLCGALLHHLHADRAETELLAPAGLDRPILDDIRDLTYPRGG
ncbi:metallophosphoesterase [Roseomonas alkaliterrae]|uniref:Alkaline phosphatase D n=1 Tax=Neoroseomonas alkaliterrae TaxID=1452450 RepID=A0A840XI35_9PROT|nr:metallophosphoesterase [Neoroseomonas alkaliterrae]MBB5688165.1 alkaline phosphatase D [Neoroseomonas alkaliterrae]MBR0676236.1 metallophosphoesterase [Neoroseomonas alkaliterrae]